MSLATFLQSLANALVLGSIYAIVSVGLALSWGVMRMANVAHGEFYMLGAYVVYVLYAQAGWPFPVAVASAFPLIAILGVLTERMIFRQTRGNVLAGYIATAGLAFMLQVVASQIWGVGLPKPIPVPYMGAAHLGGVAIGWQRLLVVPVAAGMMLLLRYFLFHVRVGKALRACAQDPEVAALQGISINRITMLAMLIAGGFAGVAGALMAPLQPVTPYLGQTIIITAFIVVIVGGIESIGGAVLAAFMLGIIHTFVTTLVDGVTATMAGVVLMAVVLVIKPEGLMGRVRA